MEKLQPILKQKYWICFGLSLIFVLFGWWNASGDLSAKTAERKTSVEGSFGKAGQGASDPNESWVAGGKKENEEDKGAYKTASLQLWQRQQSARQWPEQIRGEMQKITYFADVPSKETRERWASIYRTQIEDLLQIVQPFKNDTGEGLVVVDANRITRQPYDSWQQNRPTSNEIWSNQEDIWLLKALLTSISKTNDSATRITESQVREIKNLRLRGGDRKTKPGAVGGKSGGMMSGGMPGGMGAMGTMGGGEEAMFASGMGGGGMGGAGGGISTKHPGSSFEGAGGGDILTEEFGAVAGAAGMGGMGGEMGMGAAMGMGMPGAMSGGSSFGGGKATAKKEVRYVDDAEKDQGYKTRAFLLDVVVRDERLPDLLAKLTNSDFPVEIVRVEIMSRAAGAPSGMGGEGMSGYGGGSSGYGGGMPGGFGESSGMGYPGGAGMMSPGSSGGYGDLAGGGGLGGYGVGAAGGYPGDSIMMDSGTGVGTGAMKGVEVMNAAMADPLLIEVRIGGLLTLYMTPEEALNQEKTEEKSEEEAAAAAPVTSGTSEPAATDGTTAIASPTDGNDLQPGNEASPSADGAPTTIPQEDGSAVPSETPAEPATENPENGSPSSEPSNSSVPPE